MKCKKCGYKAKDIAHMAAHYRKAHPGTMKKKARKAKARMPKREWAMIGRMNGWI